MEWKTEERWAVTEAIQNRKTKSWNTVISVFNKLISLTSVALDLWITTPAIWAVTDWSVLHGMTFCSWTAWISYQTWVLATLTDARLISRTFRIWSALRLRWNCLKIFKLYIYNVSWEFACNQTSCSGWTFWQIMFNL